MRIGLVTGEYPPMQGGVGAYSQLLARTLAAQGHDLAVLTSVAGHDHEPPIRVRAAIQTWNLASLRTVRQWARDERLEIVNLQYQTAAYAMSPWIHALPDVVRSSRFVTTFHDLRVPYLFPKAGPMRDWAVMHLARASDGAIATNHEDYARLKPLRNAAMIPIGSNISTVLPPGFDAAAWRSRAGARTDDFLVAYFGFRNRSKGLDVLLDAIAQLRRQGVAARLVLIGGRAGASDPTNAAYADELDRRMSSLGIQAAVVETGFVDDPDVAAFLRASDVVALPFLDGVSFRRGTLMAAIQHACAIVTTTPAVPMTEFQDGVNMALVKAGTAEPLADALRTLARSPALRDRLRSGAAQLAGQFDWDRIARETVAFFERVLE